MCLGGSLPDETIEATDSEGCTLRRKGGIVMRELCNWRPTRAVLTAALAALTMAAVSSAQAAVPQATLIEGALATGNGTPATDGDYSITFSLHAGAEGGVALWSEGPAQVTVSSGRMTHRLGSVETLNAATLASAAYLEIQVGAEPPLPRQPLSAVAFAMRSSVAETLQCSGCVPLSALVQGSVDAFVTTSSLAKAAKSGSYADLADPVDLSVFAAAADLATVASSGAYADLSDLPNLDAYAKAQDLGTYAQATDLDVLAKKDALHKVATSGSYADLTDPPTLVEVGKACGTNLVVAGFKADGSLDCVLGQAADLKGDDIVVVSNGAMSNVFLDKLSSTKVPLSIPDNNPLGMGDTITVPDLGLAQKLTVSVSLTNSDISGVTLNLYDPNNNMYKLYDKGLKSGVSIDTTYPTPTKTVSGDLTTWQGKNPKGNWFIQVVDTKFKDNTTDGQLVSWSVNVQTLSNKKVQIVGDLIVDGSVTIGAGSFLPAGVMMFVNGAACPTGFVPVDGANGAPDLRGRMPIGVGNLPQGGSVALKATGGTHRWRMYGGGGCTAGRNNRQRGDFHTTGFGWQSEAEVTVGRGTSWTGYYDHLPPYRGILACIKQ